MEWGRIVLGFCQSSRGSPTCRSRRYLYASCSRRSVACACCCLHRAAEKRQPKFPKPRAGRVHAEDGKCGRRGIDDKGSVILFFSSGERDLKQYHLWEVLTGQPIALKAAFHLTSNMILNILRVDELPVEEIKKTSFSEAVGENKIDSVNNALRGMLSKEADTESSSAENADDATGVPFSITQYTSQIVNTPEYQ